ncbi:MULTISPECIES: HD-GYP domain-containing protein [Thermodesulfovibrio]|uniref:HD domain protein n=1 Tax=Thermodesulfovibrio yellowstonii (strain ATCC 51303 / DSM 11347 / YP87) TaxID=289376 RepID=B5YGD3_THEYD|nr:MULTISPECIES: HD-GYP domain-containing protein [Thermodesulfovibrio]ACI21845.1 HD domain protein [Thermodesulfovibrio yellowstonii DSM 11347]
MAYKSKIIEVPEKELFKIDVNRLQLNKPLPFDVYIQESGTYKKFFNKGIVFSNIFLEILKEKNIDSVYIYESEKKQLKAYSSKLLSETALESPIDFKNYSFYKENLYQIERMFLIPGMEVDFSIYLLKNFKITKIVDASPEKLFMIYEDTIPEEGDILIEKKDLPLYKEYIEFLSKKLDKIAEENDEEIRHVVIRESAKILMTEVLNEPRSGENIKKVGEVVNSVIEIMLNKPDSIYNLLNLKNYDYYTYIHSVNVGVLSIGLGIQIGMDRDNLYKLGIGAMLHDIGKSQIPHEILNKQGKLTDTEYNIIKQHVVLGHELLEKQKEFPTESLPAVLQHHEKLSGRGYPFGLKAEEIKLLGRITAIADCYDALTTKRPYKPALTPYFALSIVVREKGDHDPELLKTFIKMLGKIK